MDTLVQPGKIESFPIVLMGTGYWRPFQDMIGMAAEGTISPAEVNLLLITDDIDAAMAHIRRYAVERFGLRRRPTSSTWLGEPKPPAGA